ncbi:hypothetical protein V8J88_20435 [Massilia sp. W12]|uniref:hypothetical protein n=1 Tax=Massilia sp. W12 TaxID=3126507 RepID=UPI0030CAD79E
MNDITREVALLNDIAPQAVLAGKAYDPNTLIACIEEKQPRSGFHQRRTGKNSGSMIRSISKSQSHCAFFRQN